MIDKAKTTKRGGVTVYHVREDMGADRAERLVGTKLSRKSIPEIIDADADVYTPDGKMLLCFRKGKLGAAESKEFYDNVIAFAQTRTTTRGNASSNASRARRAVSKTVGQNPKIMTNIIGYIDQLSPQQKFSIKRNGHALPKNPVRETKFNMSYPYKFAKLLPLVRQIDECYRRFVPARYREQRRKANQTLFRVPGTAFTTITTNVNFQTAVHLDKGDDEDGFGNLAVLGDGAYEGGETCFPQYGIGVDVRPGDIMLMDVHQPHGNLPIKKLHPDAKRLSVVCYLRRGVWQKTKGMSRTAMRRHLDTFRRHSRQEPSQSKSRPRPRSRSQSRPRSRSSSSSSSSSRPTAQTRSGRRTGAARSRTHRKRQSAS